MAAPTVTDPTSPVTFVLIDPATGAPYGYIPPQLPSNLASPTAVQLLNPSTGAVYTASGYATSASDFDGTNDFQARGAKITGIADGKAGTFSMWLRLNGGNSTAMNLFIGAATVGGTAGRAVFVTRGATNQFSITLRNSSNTNISSVQSSGTYTASSTWLNVLSSWDLAAGIHKLYVNDLDVTSASVAPVNDTIAYNTPLDWGYGANPGGGGKMTACACEVFFHTTAIDLTVETNRRKFISALGTPVDLGADGSTPLSVQPLVYSKTGDLSSNLGTGGNFTTTGSLTACSSAP